MKQKLIITAIVALIVGLVSPAQASGNELPVPNLTYESLNSSTIRIFVNGSSATEHHICPESNNKPTGKKLADGTDEWRCDSIKLPTSVLYLDYSLPLGSTERFGVIANNPTSGSWSKWSGWVRFLNTSTKSPVTTTTVVATTTTVPAIVPVKTQNVGLPARADGLAWGSAAQINKDYARVQAEIDAILAKGRSSDCVGICYGVPSKVNGLPRNTYVRGYYRSDGTWVNPYTRSNP